MRSRNFRTRAFRCECRSQSRATAELSFELFQRCDPRHAGQLASKERATVSGREGESAKEGMTTCEKNGDKVLHERAGKNTNRPESSVPRLGGIDLPRRTATSADIPPSRSLQISSTSMPLRPRDVGDFRAHLLQLRIAACLPASTRSILSPPTSPTVRRRLARPGVFFSLSCATCSFARAKQGRARREARSYARRTCCV